MKQLFKSFSAPLLILLLCAILQPIHSLAQSDSGCFSHAEIIKIRQTQILKLACDSAGLRKDTIINAQAVIIVNDGIIIQNKNKEITNAVNSYRVLKGQVFWKCCKWFVGGIATGVGSAAVVKVLYFP